jgi:hypothetical protein
VGFTEDEEEREKSLKKHHSNNQQRSNSPSSIGFSLLVDVLPAIDLLLLLVLPLPCDTKSSGVLTVLFLAELLPNVLSSTPSSATDESSKLTRNVVGVRRVDVLHRLGWEVINHGGDGRWVVVEVCAAETHW